MGCLIPAEYDPDVNWRGLRRDEDGELDEQIRLQDVAYTKAVGGELFAATPSLVALRTGLTIASGWWNLEKDMQIGAVAGDVTKAFVHADMDEKIITRVPNERLGLDDRRSEKHTTRRRLA